MDRQAALALGANEFLDLDHDDLGDIGGVDLDFDVIGDDIQRRSTSIVRPGGTVVSVVGPAEARPPTVSRSTSSSNPFRAS
ncbi:hypothetical protein [Amycolatopsis sp. NPDC004378]